MEQGASENKQTKIAKTIRIQSTFDSSFFATGAAMSVN